MFCRKSKKKKFEKELKQRILEQVTTGGDSSCDSESNRAHFEQKRTKSELAFSKAKEKKMIDELMKKPIKSHKERIVEFNDNLDKLSEHYDIPKVSWTK
jgi:protein FAM32A